MELNIGTNIKRLRIAKGLTQEQLADLLCVSHAAVSKWELKVTYPDITMLFPLAHIFNVSIDHLIGYDEEKANAEIDEIVNEYHKLGVIGDFDKQRELIRAAGIKYPYDYRIMVRRMWIVAGGKAGNDVKRLQENKDELNEISDCILSGCTQDSIRADAVDMKAKLLHANGKTDEAIALLSTLSSWHSKIMIEQLFEKDTKEFRFWNKLNCYGMLDVAAIKLARTIRFDNTLTVKEKIARIEPMGETFYEMSKRKDMGAFCICEKAVYAILAGMLTAENASIDEIIRIRNKEFCAMKRIMNLAQTDEVLQAAIENTYKTQDIIAFESHRLLSSPHPQFTALREFPEYLDMLNKWAE
ncbi:MAG: helix-turn-helix transcriptional regulator [Clostridia bacterium]|nr:helix-turn-helix transcriptional regulator [Clostridia bacterium]